MRTEFQSVTLNSVGVDAYEQVQREFSACLDRVEAVTGKDGRYQAIVRTKMEEAAMFATKAVCARVENQAGVGETAEVVQ